VKSNGNSADVTTPSARFLDAAADCRRTRESVGFVLPIQATAPSLP
jgi:hypothetical protein